MYNPKRVQQVRLSDPISFLSTIFSTTHFISDWDIACNIFECSNFDSALEAFLKITKKNGNFMIKRVVLILVIVLLSAIVLIVLIADSPLMDEATEFLLEKVTKQEVGIGSARLTIFPEFKFTVKGLTIKEPAGAGNLISIQNLYLQGSILKLLRKDVYIKKLELIRCHLNLIDSGGIESLADLFLVPKGKHEAEESADKLSQWTVELKEARVKDGSITYVKGERTDARVHHTIENINAMVALTKGDSTIEILDCTYKSASASLRGTIKYCFTRDPEFSLQAQAAAPLSLLQGMLPSPLTKQLCESKGELSLLVNGYLSHLSLDTTINISSSLKSVYLPLTILLKGSLDQIDQLELQKLEITSPCGSVHGEGMIAHSFSEKRWLEIGWKSHLETSCFRHLFRDEVEIAGTLPCSGKIVGNGENFTTSLEGAFSSLSLSSPYFISKPNAGIQTISALLVKKEDTIEISSLKVDFDESYFDLNSKISNAFTYPKTFEASAKGTLFLPEMALLFPILKKKELVVQGDTTLNIAIAGRYDRGESFEIQEGIFRALGSEIMTRGKISNAFSKECYLSFNTKIIPGAEETLHHFPGITSRNWELIHLPPLTFSVDGPLNAVTIRADCDLKGFDVKFPHIRIHTPHEGGSLQLEATVEERRKISLHDLSLNFGSSHLNLHGTISQKAPHVLPLEIEAEGILKIAEGESTIQAQIFSTSSQSFKQHYQFAIHDFNISDVAQQLQWENVPITGKVNLYGKLEHSTMQGESFFNPNSLKGQLKITFSHGEIRKLALLRNILLLINLPTVTTFAPVLREIFIFNQVLQLAKTKGRIINLRTIPYERLEGNFIIKEGVATTEELMLISDVLTLAASGSINLQNQTLEGQIAARPFGSLRSLLLKVPMVGKKVTDIQDKLLSTYFTIEGDMGKPEVKTVILQSAKEGSKKTFRRLADYIKPKRK